MNKTLNLCELIIKVYCIYAVALIGIKNWVFDCFLPRWKRIRINSDYFICYQAWSLCNNSIYIAVLISCNYFNIFIAFYS